MEAQAVRKPPRTLHLLPRPSGDDGLVAALRAGDSGAFEAIFDRYHRPLLSFCRHMLGDRQEAEDAVQQTFMGAYRDLVSSSKPIHLRPWLYTIARNHCLSMLRARRESVPLDDVAPATEGLDSEVQRRQDLRDMLADLRDLPENQRAALVLSELGSLSHEEIGDVAGCPRTKVKALVFQARSSLAASRAARETPCLEVRQQLATLSGGALRRSGLRRHVRTCSGCQSFENEVRRQRKAMAVLLPVVPTLGLKSGVLAAVAGGGAAAASGAGGVAAGGGAGAAGAASGAAGAGSAGLAAGEAGSVAAVGGAGAGGVAVVGGAGVVKLIAAGVLAVGVGTGGVAALHGRSAPSAGPAARAAAAEKPTAKASLGTRRAPALAAVAAVRRQAGLGVREGRAASSPAWPRRASVARSPAGTGVSSRSSSAQSRAPSQGSGGSSDGTSSARSRGGSGQSSPRHHAGGSGSQDGHDEGLGNAQGHSKAGAPPYGRARGYQHGQGHQRSAAGHRPSH